MKIKFEKIDNEFESESLLYKDWKDFNFKGCFEYFTCESCKYRFLAQDCLTKEGEEINEKQMFSHVELFCPLCGESLTCKDNPYNPYNSKQNSEEKILKIVFTTIIVIFLTAFFVPIIAINIGFIYGFFILIVIITVISIGLNYYIDFYLNI